MSKTKDELLLDYRKSNKVRRAKIVAKSGHTTEAEYLDYLMQPDNVSGSKAAAALFKHNKPQIPTIHNVYIIDVSASMGGGKLTSAIQGVNTEIAQLKTDTTVNYTQTIVEFSGHAHIRTHMYKVPIKDCGIFGTRTISATALNQAVGETLTKLKKDIQNPDDKVLVKIFTDGQENDSQGEFRSYGALKALIDECEGLGFTIAFVGTQRDVDHVVQHMNISASNTLSHDNTAYGVQEAFRSSAGATMLYSKNVKAKKSVTRGFFKDLK
jgi:uncharacterized protein YegL